MKKISDYFGTKTAIKCENEQQWEKLKELCGDRLEHNTTFDLSEPLFDLNEIGDTCIIEWANKYRDQILPYSDFVSDVPELVGVEMEVSSDNIEWFEDVVFGTYEGKFIGAEYTMPYARPIPPRPITKKVLTATLQELAEMLNVDEIQLK